MATKKKAADKKPAAGKKNLSKTKVLKKISNYAKARGVHRQTVYEWLWYGKDNRGQKLKTQVIDGVIFVVTSEHDMYS